MIPYKQLSLADIFSDCQEKFENDKPVFLSLLETHIDIDEIIPISFRNHFYASTGRTRKYPLQVSRDNPFYPHFVQKGQSVLSSHLFPINARIFYSLFWGFVFSLSLKCLGFISLSPFPKNKNRPQKRDFSSHFQGLFPSFILFLGIKLFALFRINYFALEYGDMTLHIHYNGLLPIMARPKILLHLAIFF